MVLEKKKFVSYDLDEDRVGKPIVVTVKLNANEQEVLKRCKKLLQQPKDATVLKQLASVGAKVLFDSSEGYVLQILLNNKRKNLRVGIQEI